MHEVNENCESRETNHNSDETSSLSQVEEDPPSYQHYQLLIQKRRLEDQLKTINLQLQREAPCNMSLVNFRVQVVDETTVGDEPPSYDVVSGM